MCRTNTEWKERRTHVAAAALLRGRREGGRKTLAGNFPLKCCTWRASATSSLLLTHVVTLKSIGKIYIGLLYGSLSCEKYSARTKRLCVCARVCVCLSVCGHGAKTYIFFNEGHHFYP